LGTWIGTGTGTKGTLIHDVVIDGVVVVVVVGDVVVGVGDVVVVVGDVVVVVLVVVGTVVVDVHVGVWRGGASLVIVTVSGGGGGGSGGGGSGFSCFGGAGGSGSGCLGSGGFGGSAFGSCVALVLSVALVSAYATPPTVTMAMTAAIPIPNTAMRCHGRRGST
jgi:hypothetical protein